MSVQQSINQLLGQVGVGVGIGKSIKQQAESIQKQQESIKKQEEAIAQQERLAKEEREYNSPENVKKRRVAELEQGVEKDVQKWNDRIKALTDAGYSAEEAEVMASKDVSLEMSRQEELYDLSGEQKYLETWAQNQVMVDEQQKQLKEKQEQELLKRNNAIEEGRRKVERDRKTQEWIDSVLEGTPSQFSAPTKKARFEVR